MKLSKFVLEIRFKEPAGRPFNWREGLMQSIAGSSPLQPTQNKINEIIELNLVENKTKVFIESSRLAIGVENCSDIEELKKFTTKIIERVINNIDWKKTKRIGARSIWYEKTNDSFSDFVSKIKSKSFTSNSIVESSIDVALSFTLTDGDNLINYNAGAMRKEEISQKYGINTDSIPEVLLVADIDYVSTLEDQFSKNSIKGFIEKALNYSQAKSEETAKIHI